MDDEEDVPLSELVAMSELAAISAASRGQAQGQAQAAFRPYRRVRSLRGHAAAIAVVKWSPDGELLASAGRDPEIVVWSAKDWSVKARLRGHSKGVSDLAWSGDGKCICTASDDESVKVWDWEAQTCVHTLKGEGDWFNFCVDVCPKKELVAAGSWSDRLRIWHIGKGKDATSTVLRAHSDPVTAVQFNKRGSKLVTSSLDGLFVIWDTERWTYTKLVNEDNGLPPVSHVQFTPVKSSVLVTTMDSAIRLWNWRTAKITKEYFGHKNQELFIMPAVTAKGKYVVSGSEDKLVYIWDLQSKEVLQKLAGHSAPVICVASHPSSSRIASADLAADGGVINIWEQE